MTKCLSGGTCIFANGYAHKADICWISRSRLQDQSELADTRPKCNRNHR